MWSSYQTTLGRCGFTTRLPDLDVCRPLVKLVVNSGGSPLILYIYIGIRCLNYHLNLKFDRPIAFYYIALSFMFGMLDNISMPMGG